MIFDIITLPNSNQAVIVDKTRIPTDSEHYLDWDIGKPTLKSPVPYHDNEFCVGLETPILASREPIPGVYLLPEWVWDRKEFIVSKYLKAQGSHDRPDITEHDFRSGYEAAGGYTREQMWEAYYAGFCANGTETQLIEGALARYFEEYMKTLNDAKPRQLDITLNEDGSLPVDEKGVVKVNNVIY